MKLSAKVKRRAFVAASLLGAYLVAELVSLLLLIALDGSIAVFGRQSTRREQVLAASEGDQIRLRGGRAPSRFVLHPYLGFSTVPGAVSAGDHLADNEPPGPPVPDETVVVVTGGSVAENFYNDSRDVLLRELRASGCVGQGPVRLLLFALPAYKQPQQLVAVAYYLALGGKLDLLINIDGFNEVVSTVVNHRKGVFPGYPRFWYGLTCSVVSPEYLRRVGQAQLCRDRQRRLARATRPLAFSAIANLVWYLGANALDARLARIHHSLLELEANEKSTLEYHRTGPKNSVTEGGVPGFAVSLWTNASRQLDHLARRNGFAYFHFLQPNQYVPGSKPLSALERESCYDPEHYRRQIVEQGYPRLQEAGGALAREGVRFHDLTNIFREVADTLYIDDSCHFNKAGNDLMAARVARIVADGLRSRGDD